MIIYGWGYTTEKLYGPTFQHKCSNCNNEGYWVLKRIISWFTLFFLPIIPYKTRYFMFCAICQHGVYLDSSQVEKIRPIAELNQKLLDGNISQQEYQEGVLNLSSNSSEKTDAVVTPAFENKTLPTTATASQKELESSFCGECGGPLGVESNFCSGCGTARKK